MSDRGPVAPNPSGRNPDEVIVTPIARSRHPLFTCLLSGHQSPNFTMHIPTTESLPPGSVENAWRGLRKAGLAYVVHMHC